MLAVQISGVCDEAGGHRKASTVLMTASQNNNHSSFGTHFAVSCRSIRDDKQFRIRPIIFESSKSDDSLVNESSEYKASAFLLSNTPSQLGEVMTQRRELLFNPIDKC
jgi:hypothetical protein